MNSPAARTLLLDLSQRKVAVSVEAGRLRVTAPKGVVTEKLRDELKHYKPEIVALLQQREQVLDMSLAEFAQSRLQVELRVPGCSQTFWWVPTSRAAEQLVQRGIGRGRIWTAEELLRVWEGDIRDPEDVLPLIRLKLHYNCVLQSMETPPFASDGECP